jgi:hypothetical protein
MNKRGEVAYLQEWLCSTQSWSRHRLNVLITWSTWISSSGTRGSQCEVLPFDRCFDARLEELMDKVIRT